MEIEAQKRQQEQMWEQLQGAMEHPPSLDHLRWALEIAHSRSATCHVEGRSVACLCPVADMFNHELQLECAVEKQGGWSIEQHHVVLRSYYESKPQQQVSCSLPTITGQRVAWPPRTPHPTPHMTSHCVPNKHG